MKLTFVSNFLNHHQLPVSGELYKALGNDYHFIQTEKYSEERAKMGWAGELDCPFLLRWYEEPELCEQLMLESDIVIYGGLEEEKYLQPRLEKGLPVIRYSERLYREGQWKAISPRGLIKKYKDHTRYRKAEVYLLCAGAFVASDFSLVKAYPEKMFKWGYFTENICYDIDSLIADKPGQKKDGVLELLFAGRFIPLKNAHLAIELAEYLQKNGIKLHLTMAGGGELTDELKELAARLKVDADFTGFIAPEKVRKYMEKADIFLMSSNHLEGWGAVINEAMNSGCTVLADSRIGAVPFLLRHMENGLVYRGKDKEELFSLGLKAAKSAELRRKLGKAAYSSIDESWNPVNAAFRLRKFCEGLLEGRLDIADEGPLSRAEIIAPNGGYKYTRRG